MGYGLAMAGLWLGYGWAMVGMVGYGWTWLGDGGLWLGYGWTDGWTMVGLWLDYGGYGWAMVGLWVCLCINIKKQSAARRLNSSAQED